MHVEAPLRLFGRMAVCLGLYLGTVRCQMGTGKSHTGWGVRLANFLKNESRDEILLWRVNVNACSRPEASTAPAVVFHRHRFDIRHLNPRIPDMIEGLFPLALNPKP